MSDRAKQAYAIFRGGFHGQCPVPPWDDAPSWVRDVVKVAYMQGQLDGLPKKATASEQYGPHRCWFPHKYGGEVLVTIEHEIRAIDRACGYREDDEDYQVYADIEAAIDADRG